MHEGTSLEEENEDEIDEAEVSENLAAEVVRLKLEVRKWSRLIARLERAVFGQEDPKTLLWIPGILQNTADLVRIMVIAKSMMWKIGGTIIVLLVFSLVHSFGISDFLIKAAIELLKAIPTTPA